MKHSPRRLRTGTSAVKLGKQFPKNLIIPNLEKRFGSTDSNIRALIVRQFTVYAILTCTSFEMHQVRKQ